MCLAKYIIISYIMASSYIMMNRQCVFINDRNRVTARSIGEELS